jgi:hypothetical protein
MGTPWPRRIISDGLRRKKMNVQQKNKTASERDSVTRGSDNVLTWDFRRVRQPISR